jgi:aminoglycoside phosphotransferase (APT) family kinase protein
MEIDFEEVGAICRQHQVDLRAVTALAGSFGKQLFLINQDLLLRLSADSMAREQEKFRRVAGLDFVPKILHTGAHQRAAGPVYYTLLTLLPGDDFVNAYQDTTAAQQQQLGAAVSAFLDRLQALTGSHYDIGLYVPALPNFAGTWREGHQHYWEILQQAAAKIPLQPGSSAVFERAFQFLHTYRAVLDVQSGPKLLHNDFHPRNILLDRGRFSGVIDWECSQYGEADFELCHLIHWCVYPPKPNLDFRPFLRGLFAAAPAYTRVPGLARRLTLYQIEHEIQQIIWNAGQAESWRVPRLAGWMDGDVDALFRQIR